MELSRAWEPGDRERAWGFIWAKNLSVVFIVETRTDEARLKEIKRKLKFDHMFLVPRIHRGGGLVFFRKGVNEFASGDIFKKSHRLYH